MSRLACGAFAIGSSGDTRLYLVSLIDLIVWGVWDRVSGPKPVPSRAFAMVLDDLMTI